MKLIIFPLFLIIMNQKQGLPRKIRFPSEQSFPLAKLTSCHSIAHKRNYYCTSASDLLSEQHCDVIEILKSLKQKCKGAMENDPGQ